MVFDDLEQRDGYEDEEAHKITLVRITEKWGDVYNDSHVWLSISKQDQQLFLDFEEDKEDSEGLAMEL